MSNRRVCQVPPHHPRLRRLALHHAPGEFYIVILYYIILYYIILYYIILYDITLYTSSLHCIVLCCIASHHNIPFFIPPPRAFPLPTAPHLASPPNTQTHRHTTHFLTLALPSPLSVFCVRCRRRRRWMSSSGGGGGTMLQC